MATDSSTPRQPPAGQPAPRGESRGKLVEYEEFIETQLRKTRGQVRSVDLAGDLMLLAAGTLGYFFLAAILDHWVVPGGMGFVGRLVCLAVFLAAAGYYLIAHVLPLLVRRINPIYAAHTIERSRPSLKNGLVNFLLFRANPGGVSPRIYEAVEEQAATNLAQVRIESTVDRSKLVHVGYLLVGIVFVCALYTVLSPKNLFKTVGRVVMPWADIGAPTRSVIDEIEPGDAQTFRGQQVAVLARIQGLPAGGKVTLFYSTADGQTVDHAVEMNLPPDGYRHKCVLPSADTALQQSLSYRIEAGDAVTKTYRVEVVAAPTIVVRSVDYAYPAYTGLLPQRVEHQGDLKAIEGTDVTVEAVANQDIESAGVDFDCDRKLDVRMQADKQEAKATFRLALKDDRQTPEHTSYQLIFKNQQGRENPQSVRHQIEVTADLPPEIQFVSPKQDEIDLPANGSVDLEIVANDPDFALRLVKLSASSGKQPLFDKLLLDEVWRGQFVKKFRFEPRKLGLKPGDAVDYTALAEDNKDPRPNRTETAKRRIRIVSPGRESPAQDPLAQIPRTGDGQGQPDAKGEGSGDNDHPRDKQGQLEKKSQDSKPSKTDSPTGETPADPDQQPDDAKDEQNQEQGQNQDQGSKTANSTAKGAEQRPGGKSEKSGASEPNQNVASDGSDDGDAFEQILKHRDEQDKANAKPENKQPQKRQGDQKPSGEPQQSDKDQAADQEQGDAGKQNQSPADGQQDKDQPGKSGQGKGKQNDKGKAGDQSKNPSQTERGQRPLDAGEQNKDASDPRQGDKPQGDKSEAGQQGGGKQADKNTDGAHDGKKPDKRPQQPSKDQPDMPDPAEPPKKQQGSGAGEAGGGNEGGGGQQGEKDQSGEKGQSARSSRQGQGQGANPGEAGDNPDGKKSDQPGKGQGKPSTSKSGDETQSKGDAAQGSKAQGGDKPKGQSDAAGDMNPDEKLAQDSGSKSAKRDAGRAKPGEKPTGDDRHPAGEDQPGNGAQSIGNPSGKQPNQKSPPDKPKPDATGGDGEKEKGESGAGQSSKEQKPSPSPEGENQPRDKSDHGSPDDKDAKRDDAQPSPSNSKHDSDSQGLEEGDRAGGGKKGGGQKANKRGTGGPGQNTPADEGAGRSDEPGDGETTDGAGDRKADKPTGHSGSDPGKGSANKPSDDAKNKPAPGKNDQQNSPQSKPGQPSNGEQAAKPGSEANDQSGDGSPSGGRPADRRKAEQNPQPGAEVADEANLDYARKATDLALRHLKDELSKDKPDPELLNRLGWTKKDLESFVTRWEQMRKQAQTPGDKGIAARKELDETLRSLGLRPRAASVKSNAARDDQMKGVKESRRTMAPPEYIEQSKAYSQGTARGGK